MPLARPRVVGPLSELSRKVHVKGQLVDAQVTVFSVGPIRRQIIQGLATKSDEWFDLPVSENLLFTDELVAVQKQGSDESAAPNADMELKVRVMKAPTQHEELTCVGFVSALFKCGRALWLKGGFPGANANISIAGVVAGTGTFLDSEGARLTLSTPLASTTVGAWQSVPGVGDGPPMQRIPFDVAGRHGDPLMPPMADPSPVACDESVQVTHVIDGAEVFLTVSDGRTSTELYAMFDRNALLFPVGAPLTDTEQISLRQEVAIQCERTSITKTIPVGTAPSLLPPKLPDSLCAGSVMVTTEKVHPNALVELEVSATVYKSQAPLTGTTLDTTLDIIVDPPLVEGYARARQFHCNRWSDWTSPSVKIEPSPDTLPRMTLIEPLYSCRTTVDIKDAHPGGCVQVFSQKYGSISDYVPCHKPDFPVDVPTLIADDHVYVIQWACGAAYQSNTPKVKEHPENLPKPIPQLPLFIGDTKIHFSELVPGATLITEIRDGTSNDIKQVVQHIASAGDDDVDLVDGLADRDTVTARQSMCNDLSTPSDAAAANHIPITADWFTWDNISSTQDWNREYVVGGIFTNKGSTPLNGVHCQLWENASSPGEVTPGRVEPNESVRVAYPLLKQTWSWLTPAVWVVHDSYVKTFIYVVDIDAQDELGQSYPRFRSKPLPIVVQVSSIKRAAAITAFSAASDAVVLTAVAATFFAGIITAGLGAASLIAAGIAATVSATSGSVALDPPTPDSNFRRRVELPAREAAPNIGDISDLAALLLGIKNFMELELAKSSIEGRRLGALQANDPRWAALHSEELNKAIKLQLDAIKEVQSLRPTAVTGLAQVIRDVSPTTLASQRREMLVSGIPLSMLHGSSLTPEDIARLNVLVQSPDVAYPNPDGIADLHTLVSTLVSLIATLTPSS
ncbi:hypothetical protein CNMCM5623_005594 [Aspergillus felis]|uniref:Uncharacterized protein n=1 Tax=Aspergillus felis TaxID=1287682 RepID=A0A8H6QJG4_9EURO|nr:hypothetical protein CNMCM5623_005594 [Aspergillus felis]